MSSLTVVFVHGWSVTDLDTYGELPERLVAEGARRGIDIRTQTVFLGRYISFHDEVHLNDISRAFRAAVSDQLANVQGRFICITHSTGGPVIRDWWQRYYLNEGKTCPMSHLIMMAPANYGSALAQLGKGRLSRIKSWFDGVEPGQGVLDWLELGSAQAWTLNREWIFTDDEKVSADGIFPFVIAGQDIDRKLYDHLNSYTGESGSDGVVRVAAANLHGRYIRLEQPIPKNANETDDFTVAELKESIVTPLRVVSKKSHSGKEMGIIRSVKKELTDVGSIEAVDSIFACLGVQTRAQYDALVTQFENETREVQNIERLEVHNGIFPGDRYFFHDRYSMVIFRVRDTEGYPVTDYDLLLTAGEENLPDHLPPGFFVDRQKNSLSRDTITYFFNFDVMKGCPPVKNADGKIVRPALPGTTKLGFELIPRPSDGFVHYLPCRYVATSLLLEKALVPNSTTLIEIVLQRVVSDQVFRLEKLQDYIDKTIPPPCGDDGNFEDMEPGDYIVK